MGAAGKEPGQEVPEPAQVGRVFLEKGQVFPQVRIPWGSADPLNLESFEGAVSHRETKSCKSCEPLITER